MSIPSNMQSLHFWQGVKEVEINKNYGTNLEEVSLVLSQLATVQDMLPVLSVIPEVGRQRKKKFLSFLVFYLIVIQFWWFLDPSHHAVRASHWTVGSFVIFYF